jgi:hypothetical protein
VIAEVSSSEPGTVIPRPVASEGRRRGASGPRDGTAVAPALEVLRDHRWAAFDRQPVLYRGARHLLTEAVRALTGSGGPRDRAAVLTALQRIETEPPEWLVPRLCLQQDDWSTEGSAHGRRWH